MNGRGHDVRGTLPRNLNDVLAEIGLDRLDAGSLERRIEMNLFGGHRFAFDGPPHARLFQDLDDDLTGILAIGGK